MAASSRAAMRASGPWPGPPADRRTGFAGAGAGKGNSNYVREIGELKAVRPSRAAGSARPSRARRSRWARASATAKLALARLEGGRPDVERDLVGGARLRAEGGGGRVEAVAVVGGGRARPRGRVGDRLAVPREHHPRRQRLDAPERLEVEAERVGIAARPDADRRGDVRQQDVAAHQDRRPGGGRDGRRRAPEGAAPPTRSPGRPAPAARSARRGRGRRTRARSAPRPPRRARAGRWRRSARAGAPASGASP